MSYKIPESVLVVIHTAELDVLLIERADKPGFWQSVTGSKDSIDEDLRLTAQREVFEETGFCSSELLPTLASSPSNEMCVPTESFSNWQLQNIYEIYPVWRHRYAPGVTRNTEHVFGLVLPSMLTPQLSPREHLQFRWLPYQAAADLCFSPSNAEAILQLPARFKASN